MPAGGVEHSPKANGRGVVIQEAIVAGQIDVIRRNTKSRFADVRAGIMERRFECFEINIPRNSVTCSCEIVLQILARDGSR